MSDTKRVITRRIPLWLNVTLACVNGLAVAVASQVYRYAHGTALALWYIGLGAVIIAYLSLAPIRQWLTDRDQRVRIDVKPATIGPIPDPRERTAFQVLFEKNARPDLMAHLENYQEPAPDDLVEGRDYIRANQGRGARIMLPTEKRTAEQYTEQVDTYIREAQKYFRDLAHANYARLGFGMVTLNVHSLGETVLDELRIRVKAEDENAQIIDPEDIEYPSPPRSVQPYGERKNRGTEVPPSLLNALTSVAYVAPPRLMERADDGSVVFDPIEVRSDAPESLPTFYVIWKGAAESTITFSWSATAKGALGFQSGTFTLQTGLSRAGKDELFRPEKEE